MQLLLPIFVLLSTTLTVNATTSRNQETESSQPENLKVGDIVLIFGSRDIMKHEIVLVNGSKIVSRFAGMEHAKVVTSDINDVLKYESAGNRMLLYRTPFERYMRKPGIVLEVGQWVLVNRSMTLHRPRVLYKRTIVDLVKGGFVSTYFGFMSEKELDKLKRTNHISNIVRSDEFDFINLTPVESYTIEGVNYKVGDAIEFEEEVYPFSIRVGTIEAINIDGFVCIVGESACYASDRIKRKLN